jgi:hypothetical protein
MLPAITEVEGEGELVARRDGLSDLDCRVILDDCLVLDWIRVHEPDPPAISELELMQMRQIPPRESLIDRVREHQERVRRPDDEDPARTRLQPRAMPAEKINPNLKPRPRHRDRTLRNGH